MTQEREKPPQLNHSGKLTAGFYYSFPQNIPFLLSPHLHSPD